MTKKIIIGVVVIFIVLVIGVPYAQNKKVEEVTTADMDFELLEEGSNNYQICGLWDDDNKDKYQYIVIKPQYVMDVYGIAQITEIGEGAFENHSKIETIHIPSCVTVIRKNAFLGCANLKKITFGGTEEQWKKIIIEGGNETLDAISIEYQVATPNVN